MHQHKRELFGVGLLLLIVAGLLHHFGSGNAAFYLVLLAIYIYGSGAFPYGYL